VEPSRAFGRNRFGLSEIEVFSGGTNVARQGTVDAVADPSAMSRGWPKQQLVDGFTSYGRLIELPDWLAAWQRRTELGARLAALDARHRTLVATAERRLAWSGGGLGLAALAGAGVWLVRQRRRRARELELLRTRLARDLHDEIGSNLAGLAMLSEAAGGDGTAGEAAREDWREVNRIARESTDAMREVLWVVGAREEAGFDLATQLQRAAARVLPGRRVVWAEPPASPPAGWSAETRRQVFLFFKEALANVARHAQASEVRLGAACRDGAFELTVADDGRGFDPARAAGGIGLASLRERARTLGGSCMIDSAPGKGTRVTLRVPV
jgi:signal transduction histidine kinase